jgi:hypothetical protein
MKSTKIVLSTFACSTLLALGGIGDLPSKPAPPPKTLDVVARYSASGGMGDATNQTTYVQMDLASRDHPRNPNGDCVKVKYTIGPARWAGFYWLNKPDNWGSRKGDDLSQGNYSKVSFWIRGETGREKVEFKAGGVQDEKLPNKDSFEVSTGTIRLSKEWQHEEIDLRGQNLSSVIGLFCWVASGDANSEGVTFYLDSIEYQGPGL